MVAPQESPVLEKEVRVRAHPEMSPEQALELMQGAKAQIESGQANEHGVKMINAYFGSGGQAYCLSEAADAEAVVKSHETVCIPQSRENIHEVTGVV